MNTIMASMRSRSGRLAAIPGYRGASLVAIAMLIGSASLFAQPAATPSASSTQARGDAQAGAAVAEKGVAGVPACSGCHSVQAIQGSEGQFPLLDGQTEYYVAKQLRDFVTGSRPSAVMQPIAKSLSDKQIVDVSSDYASRPAPALAMPNAPAATVKRGETLTAIGDERLGLQGCVNCHGNAAHGEGPAIPYLTGQDADYIVAQLKAFGSRTRQNDEGAVMRSAVANMPDSDMQAVALYLSPMRPPGRLVQNEAK